MRRSFFLTLLLVTTLWVGYPMTAVAQDATAVATQTISGEILRVQDNQLTVQSEGQTYDYTIPAGVKITRNGMGASIEDLAPNDRVSITQSSDMEILSIDATAGSAVDTAKVLGPLLLLLGLAAIAAIILLKKRSTSHIKTTT